LSMSFSASVMSAEAESSASFRIFSNGSFVQCILCLGMPYFCGDA